MVDHLHRILLFHQCIQMLFCVLPVMSIPLRDALLPELRQDETRPLNTVHFCSRDDLCYSRPIAGNLMTASDGIRAHVKKFFLRLNFILTQASLIATFFDKVHERIPKNSLMNFSRSLLMRYHGDMATKR